MKMPLVMVTAPAGEEKKELVRSMLAGMAGTVFLTDLSGGDRDRALAEAEVLLAWDPLRELGRGGLHALDKVRMIQLLSAGADQLPFAELRPGIMLASNVGAYAEPMAEHILAMVLALSKDLLQGHRDMAAGRFDQSVRSRVLRGRTCGILGFGGIGRAAARLLRCLGTRIVAVNTSGRTDEDVDLIGTLADLGQVLARSDIVVVSLPLTRATRGLIGARELSLMRPDGMLINVARGAVIDEEALYAHLLSHPGFRAGIDVWWAEPFRDGEFRADHPFLSLPNVLGSPHNSAIAPGSDVEAMRKAVENIARFLAGGQVSGLVRREDYLPAAAR